MMKKIIDYLQKVPTYKSYREIADDAGKWLGVYQQLPVTEQADQSAFYCLYMDILTGQVSQVMNFTVSTPCATSQDFLKRLLLVNLRTLLTDMENVQYIAKGLDYNTPEYIGANFEHAFGQLVNFLRTLPFLEELLWT